MKNNSHYIEPAKAGGSALLERNGRQRRLIAIFWIMALALGGLQAWASRYYVYTDGISYLDMGDAYLRGDWDMAINAYWSPFYSWLLGLALLVLKPSLYWEAPVVHLVNFAIYLCAMGCFHFLLVQVIRHHQGRADGVVGDSEVTFPEWAWLALGYALFMWSSLNLIGISEVTPDLCVAAFVYLACGILLRIGMGASGWLAFILLGVVLGFGYLTKAAMFPLAFVFLGVSMYSVGNFRRAVPRVLIGMIVFLLVAAPLIVALSKAKGRLTFGDSGRLNYAWFVNAVTRFIHWQGGPPGSGTPKHPTRKIADMPAIYEFGTPIGGTHPPWYDPSYWYEGVIPHFELKGQIRVLLSSAKTYSRILFESQQGLIVGVLVLYLMGHRRLRRVKPMAARWILLIPAIAAIGMYSLVYVDPRFTGAFVTLLWLGVFSGVRLTDSKESRRLIACVSLAMVLITIITLGISTVRMVYESVRDPTSWLNVLGRRQLEVAEELKQMGVQPGDKVAVISYGIGNYYWARLARVRIVAEIPKDMRSFWATGPAVKSQAILTFAKTGVKVIVAERVPTYVSTTGWQRIGNTDYYAYFFAR